MCFNTELLYKQLFSCNFITNGSWKTMNISVNSLREETHGVVIFFLFWGHNMVIHPGGIQFNKPYLNYFHSTTYTLLFWCAQALFLQASFGYVQYSYPYSYPSKLNLCEEDIKRNRSSQIEWSAHFLMQTNLDWFGLPTSRLLYIEIIYGRVF